MQEDTQTPQIVEPEGTPYILAVSLPKPPPKDPAHSTVWQVGIGSALIALAFILAQAGTGKGGWNLDYIFPSLIGAAFYVIGMFRALIRIRHSKLALKTFLMGLFAIILMFIALVWFVNTHPETESELLKQNRLNTSNCKYISDGRLTAAPAGSSVCSNNIQTRP